MGLNLKSSFTVLFALALTCISLAGSLELSARSLDALLQRRAFEALSFRPRTGVVSDAKLPGDLTGLGVSVSAVRLRSGSLRSRGFDEYREFRIPAGVIEQPYTKRVVLVYQNLGANFSSRFYPLPGFTYLAPVLGLIAYDASNLSAVDLPELDLQATGKPITARFGDVIRFDPPGAGPKCVFFDLHGSVQFDEPLPGNTCEMVQQGHLSLVIESTAPSPAPAGGDYYHGGARVRVHKSNAGLIAAGLVAVLVLMAVAVAVVFGLKFRDRRYSAKSPSGKEGTEFRLSDMDGALQMTSFGNIRAPFARVTRTQPVLEDCYVP